MKFYLALTIALVALVAVNAGVIQPNAMQPETFALTDDQPTVVEMAKAEVGLPDEVDSMESVEDAESAEEDEDDEDSMENDDDIVDSDEEISSEESDEGDDASEEQA